MKLVVQLGLAFEMIVNLANQLGRRMDAAVFTLAGNERDLIVEVNDLGRKIGGGLRRH
jgi:hypothetical protein